MARRIGKGFVGKSILGDLVVDGNTIKTIKAGANLAFDATGNIESVDNLQINSQGTLRLYDSDDSNYVELRSAGTVAGDLTYTLPNSITDGYFLQTDSSGNLTFAQPAISVSNNTTSTSTFYLTLTTATSGDINGVTTTDSKLSFQPSTGDLTVTAFSCGSVDVNGGNIDGTVIGAASAAAGTFSSLTETSSIAYKENVSPIQNGLDKILQLVGVEYDRIDGSSKNEAGLIAEEVEKVLPNIVSKKDGRTDGINYTKLTAYLIESIKSLQEQIEELKRK